MHKTEKDWKETTVKIVQERNCEQEFIRLSAGLTQEGMLAGAKGMIIGVVCYCRIGSTKLACEKGLAF